MFNHPGESNNTLDKNRRTKKFLSNTFNNNSICIYVYMNAYMHVHMHACNYSEVLWESRKGGSVMGRRVDS